MFVASPGLNRKGAQRAAEFRPATKAMPFHMSSSRRVNEHACYFYYISMNAPARHTVTEAWNVPSLWDGHFDTHHSISITFLI